MMLVDVDAASMEICAAVMFLVCTSPSDIAVNGEDEAVVWMMEMLWTGGDGVKVVLLCSAG